jgi:UDP-N-acetylmuramate: L-alanyl-gamma-D-glutamyl-meso-diaminopimelate ligase
MHLHILGICGTFMGGIAAIARVAGYTVTGCDANVYPPMSTQLQTLGIALTEGYAADQLDGVAKDADVFVIGNAISRGNPLLEAILDAGRPYTSGPQWLAETVLPGKWVLAVAGTHGKTSTSAMLAWILEQAGLAPGFLIGGADRLPVSAPDESAFFVIEADIRHRILRQAVEIRPTTRTRSQQPRVHHADIFRPGRDRDAVPPSRALIQQRPIIVNGGEASRARARTRLG